MSCIYLNIRNTQREVHSLKYKRKPFSKKKTTTKMNQRLGGCQGRGDIMEIRTTKVQTDG